MRGQYNENTKGTALAMRKAGMTYDQIHSNLNVSKSTLWTWLSGNHSFSDRKKQKEHLKRIRPLALMAKRAMEEKQKNELTRHVSRWISHASLHKIEFQKVILASLYWAEGARYKGVSGLRFVNTDPDLMLLFITLLRNCYPVEESRFRVTLHVHGYHSIRSATKFWSRLLNVSPKQFNKPYVKPRNRQRAFRRTVAGICLLGYLDSDIRKDIMETARQMTERLSSPSFNG